MTGEERTALQRAIQQLNALLASLGETYGDRVTIRPIANFNTDSGYAQVTIEVTTGVERFR